ncbi:DUF1684 domain-containing protein [Lutibacter sp. A80]|uniref:DUF1684 domain-containing protein n=1 Tax=Lutibacter sp. A80 TaxID=2918453 RepID=UPI001F067814|nr:DUF1684 domain-containing protein [Lutibacter sp. A80]UMB60206.1 DUF1684 domain-containing protein [Lutibacter sp. A80]
MKEITLAILFLLTLTNCSKKTNTYKDEIKQFQYKLNTQFANAEESPLTEEDLKTFKSLEFFEIDESFRIEANFELTPNTPIFEMKTTTDRLPLYKKYGIATFTLNGTKLQLSLYQHQSTTTIFSDNNPLFLPFKDTTNGTSTYGGGRYIDIEIPEKESNTIIIDFNQSYNPYCTYNYKFSCPTPPSENNLPIAILAGVKAYNNTPH